MDGLTSVKAAVCGGGGWCAGLAWLLSSQYMSVYSSSSIVYYSRATIKLVPVEGRL